MVADLFAIIVAEKSLQTKLPLLCYYNKKAHKQTPNY